MTKPCKNCLKPIEQTSNARPKEFCTPSCKMQFHRRQKITPPIEYQEPPPPAPVITTPIQTELTEQQQLEQHRSTPEYRDQFPPGTTFLPLKHPIPAFRGLAVPANTNPEAFIPIQPHHFHNARNQPVKASTLKSLLENP